MEKEIRVCVVMNKDRKSIRCIYLNQYRVIGGKQYISEYLPSSEFTVSFEDMKRAGFVPAARILELEAARDAARNEALEEAARLIEENTCATSSETGQYLTPRIHGDNHVIGYAAAIRALNFKEN